MFSGEAGADGERELGDHVACVRGDDGSADEDTFFIADQFHKSSALVGDVAARSKCQWCDGGADVSSATFALGFGEPCLGDLWLGIGDAELRLIV